MDLNKIENGRNCTIGMLFSGDNKVVIPDMQREYCWAKTINPITGQSLVYNFVQDIVKLHTKSNIRMGLLYAYQAPQTFIQLCDGQQRITTLYLLLGILHKKLIEDNNAYADNLRRILISEFEENNDDKEPRLQYAIRESTLWFTRDLVNEYFLKPSHEGITNSSWFFDEYKLDPSIENMVEAITIIKSILHGCSLSEIVAIAQFVVEKISFLYYDMGNRQYGEDQFVVINTTGVGLSNTENIKPKLMSSITDIDKREYYSRKWENEWEQFFWEKLRDSDSKTYIVDNDFNEFLRWVFIIEKSGVGTLSSEKNKYNPAQRALNGDPFNILEIANGNGDSIAETIDSYIKAYKLIVEKNLFPNEWLSIQRDKDGHQQPISQIDALRFLPLLYFTKSYLVDKEAGREKIPFARHFLRLKQFLWGRSRAGNIRRASIETVPRAIEIVKRVCLECNYDIAKFPQLDINEDRFFTRGERIKYDIYNKREKEEGEDVREIFEDSIWEIESLNCCQGNITFVYDALEQNLGKKPEEIGIRDYDVINQILERTFNNPNNAFKRALLTYGDYSVWIGSTPSLNAWKYSLGDDATFFRNLIMNNNDEKKRQILLSFLSSVYASVETMDDDSIMSGVDKFIQKRYSEYSNPNPDSPWRETLDKFIIEPQWLEKAKLGRFAWDENQQKFYILYHDRSNQGVEPII